MFSYEWIKWGASSWWSSPVCCSMRKSDELTIGKAHPTLYGRNFLKAIFNGKKIEFSKTVFTIRFMRLWRKFLAGIQKFSGISKNFCTIPFANAKKLHTWRNHLSHAFWAFYKLPPVVQFCTRTFPVDILRKLARYSSSKRATFTRTGFVSWSIFSNFCS